MNYLQLRNKTYRLFAPEKGGQIGRITDIAIMVLILFSVVAIILETVDSIAAQYSSVFFYFERFAIAVFTVEYLSRIWSITTSEKYQHPVTGRFRYALTPYLLIDLLAILPFYLGGFVDLRFLRILRLFRIFRVLKIARYSDALATMGVVLRKKKPDLVISVVVTTMLLVLASSMMYYVEGPAQPEVYSSIPATFWWGVVTLTTVGYGDVFPVTMWGQLLAAISAFLGVGLFALPASILASGFINEATGDDESEYEYCPHCGEQLD